MAEIKKGLSNNQKASLFLDVMKTVNIDAEIDKAIQKRKYKVHAEKLRNYKYELEEVLSQKTEVKSIFSVAFKSMGILEKARWSKQRIDDGIANKMKSMYEKIGGTRNLAGGQKKSVVFGGTEKTKVVDFAK